ncbi:MAG: ATP-binding cassette domain-containing protein [Lachnospiraceae bacterium]|nr:ATP-binding cassette domain-containing protein [Lachnospiraceae bacterium]
MNIASSYGKKKVLCAVNIAAGAGQCVGIVGTNGCGKSTLLNILAGLRKADSGEIYFDGVRAQGRQPFIRYAGYVPQESSLIPELSVMDNLRLWYEDADALRQSLEQGFLRALGVDRMCRERAGKLSGGMKKRVSIGCALAGNPPILILDEPDAALDLPGKADIRGYLGMYKQMGGTVLLATHDEIDLELCDRVFALSGGVSKEIDRTLRGEALLRQIKE